MLPTPPTDARALAQYGRRVAQIAVTTAVHMWLPVALSGPEAWATWNRVRLLADHSPSLSVVVELSAEAPPPAELRRWLAEPLKAAVFPASLFVPNEGGFPVLPRSLQVVLHALHHRGVQCLVRPPPGLSPGQDEARLRQQALYLKYCATLAPTLTSQHSYEAPYFDKLQAPLQPLADNLECATYEVFERDVAKYDAYERALIAALAAQPERGRPIDVLVVGAGRGPLVARTLAASDATSRAVAIVAVEKNPNAVRTLSELVSSQGWGGAVRVVPGDMRALGADVRADILVSELLGSFGDNELSPECLDPVMSRLREGGVSVPQAYTSFLAPVTASAVWASARAFKEARWLETPYVVRLFAAETLDAPQPAFTFTHGRAGDPRPRAALCDGMPVGDLGTRDERGGNRRRCALSFVASVAALVHGFAGYFDCSLAEGVRMSTHPANATPGMSSWFPVFFPIAAPITVAAGQIIIVHVWRCVSEARRCVWYEWALAAPVQTHVHNANGSAYVIRL
jgi:protein arginine N-methyltransferase 5